MLRRLVAPTLLSLALATSTAAGEPTETLRKLFDDANRVLLNPGATHETRMAALRALVRDAFDARAAAGLALGREWQVRTPAEREEFHRLYADVVERAYLGGVGSRARVHADGIRVAFASERVHGAQATVVTTLETRAGGSVPVEYRMRRRERGWAVVDVVVEGLSLASSYRAQFQRVMQHGTYADLVARLRETASTLTPVAVTVPTPVLIASAAPVSDAPLTAAVSSERKRFWVQVGAFRDMDAVSRVVEQLRTHSVMVATEARRRSPLARVLVGPFLDRAAAAAVLKELTVDGYRAFVAFE